MSTKTKDIEKYVAIEQAKWIAWGETISVHYDNKLLCRINPEGDSNNGIPSMEDRATANLIVNALNSHNELLGALKKIAESEGILNASDAKGFKVIAIKALAAIQ